MGDPADGDRSADTQALSRALDVLQSFHEVFVADRAAARIRPAAHYAALFPGFEDLVREQYRLLREDDPPVRVPSTPGPVLARLLGERLGNLTTTREMARGGMGVVYRVRDEILHRDLAMKVLLDDAARVPRGTEKVDSPTLKTGASLRRMIQEAQITAQLSHPGIVPVHAMGIDSEGRLYFTMTMVRGRTLFEIFSLVRDRREGWTQTRALQVFIRICDTLAFAHSKGVIHRDIKPSNIMVGAFGEVFVMDWGVAKILHADPGAEPLSAVEPPSPAGEAAVAAASADPMTVAGSILGTPEYMPPEQASGRIDVLDRRADVYSVGAMLYELLAGGPPYEDPSGPRTALRVLQAVTRGPPEPIESRAPRGSAELAAICRRAMARDPADRYQTAEELANELHRFLDGRVVLAHRGGPFVEWRAWVRRNRVLAGTVAASLLLLFSGAIVYAVDQRDAARVIEGERDAARVAEAKERGERRRAVGLRLAAQSATVVDRFPALALQLAVEAAERAPGAESGDALYAALARSQERRRLLGHDGYAIGGSWSRDGSRVLTWEWGACAILWDAESGSALHRFLGHEVRVLAAVLSPDGTRVATAGSEGTLRLSDAATGRLLRVLEGHEGQVAAAAFSPDGRLLASGGDDGTVRLWSAAGGEEIRVLRGHDGPVRDVAFSPEGDRVASISGDGTCRLFDRASGNPVLRVATREGAVDRDPFPNLSSSRVPYTDRVLFAAGGRTLVTFASGILRLHALGEGEPRVLAERERAISPAVSGDGRRVAAVAWQSPGHFAIERWEAVDGSPSGVVPVGDRLYGLSLDRRGARAAGGREGFDGEIWDLADGRRASVLRGHAYTINTTAWAPDDARVLTNSSDFTSRIWAAEPPDAVRLPANCPAGWMSPDGGRRLRPEGDLAGAEVPLAVVDSADGRTLVRFTAPGPVTRLQWLGDGAQVGAAGPAGYRVFDADTGREDGLVPFPPGGEGIDPSDWSADLSRCVFRRRDGVLVVYDRSTDRWLAGPSKAGHFAPYLSPDGRRLLTLEGDQRTATLWGLDPLRTLRVLPNHNGYALTGAWSADGKVVATAAMDGAVRLWDAETGAERATASPVPLQTNVPALGNGGRWLLVHSVGEVLLFDAETGDPLATFREPAENGAIRWARFVEGRRAIAAGTGEGGLVRLWPFDPLAAARRRLPIDLEPPVVRDFQLLPEEGREAYQEKWLRRHPTARGFIGRARGLLKAGAVEQAAAWLEETRALRPDFPEISWCEASVRSRRASGLPAGPARDREIDLALAALAKVMERGKASKEDARNQRERARAEPDLAALRGDPRFEALVGR